MHLMFKKTSNTPQLNLFTSPKSLLSGKSLSLYEDQMAWHNKFRQHVTMRVDENIFRPLYCENNGTPNAPIRTLLSMMVLKEAEGLSDQKLFENCRFNMLTRSAIGLLNANDHVPTESTYYLFRKRITDYAKAEDTNLFEVVFAQITKSQCVEFEVSGKRIRMDSKLLGSNIAWLSRYELIHETLRLFYKQINQSPQLDSITKGKLDHLLRMDGNKVVYTCSNEEVKSRIEELGILIYTILPLFSSSTDTHYQTLNRVFNEQYKVDENKVVTGRAKEEISAKSVQSPHDTDSHFRNKDGDKVKGYSINVTESCDDHKPLNLISHIEVQKVSTSDVEFLKNGIKQSNEVFLDNTENAHADGAYHSPDNQKFCSDNKINLYLHAIQGAKGRYQFESSEDGELSIFDTVTKQYVDSKKITSKKGIIKWRIKKTKGYRYFFQKDIDAYLIRKKIKETPIEILQKRNNVEATIFQLAYHYPNAKSRYRGQIKHQMWANMRCLWVNFVRILKSTVQQCKASSFFSDFVLKLIYIETYLALKTLLKTISQDCLSHYKNNEFSMN